MKSVVSDYRYRVICLRITPLYGAGTVIRLTAHPVDLTMSNGQVYKADSGYEFTGYSSGSGGSPGVVDIEGILLGSGVSRDAIASGVYDNARINVFATDWPSPVEDDEPFLLGFFGRTERRDDRWHAEAMGAQDVLNQSVGYTVTPNCQKKFGGTEYGGCQKALGPLTVTGTITSVTDRWHFADSARAEAADYFTAGLIRFTSGANAGLKAQEIKVHASGGAFTLFEPFHYPFSPGDAYILVPGCRKRLADCIAWGNVARFGGHPHVPTETTYTKVGSGAS